MISRTKILFIILAFIILAFVFIVYNQYKVGTNKISTNISKNTPPTINVGIELWPGFLVIPLAERLGYFTDEGLDVKTITYEGYEELRRDMVSKILQARGGYVSEIVDNAQNVGDTERIVLLTDYSLGGDALVARKGAGPIRAAIKPRIGLVGAEDFFLIWILKSFEKTLNQVQLTYFDTEEESLAALTEGSVDYIYTYEPYLSQAVNNGASVEYTSKDAPGIVTDVISFQKAYVEEYPTAVNSFVKAYFRAFEYWKNNPTQAYILLGSIFDMTAQEFVEQLKSMQMLDLNDNVDSMEMTNRLQSIYKNVRLINMFTNEYINASLLTDPDDLIYQNAVKSLYNSINEQSILK